MKTTKILGWLLMLVGMTALVFLNSCAGSRDDSEMIGDEAFANQAEAGESTQESTNTSAEEEEVLKLLGITKDNEQSQSATEFAESGGASLTAEDLERKIDYLENEAKSKSVELANLKAELAERDQRLQSLQSEAKRTKSYSGSVATSGASGSFKQQYQSALTLYNNREYKEGIKQFDYLLGLNESNSLVDNCQYWKGECYYALGDYNQALMEFQKVFTFSNSNKFDDSQLKLGLCYMRLGNNQSARMEFEKLLSDYPDSEYVSRAQSYLSGL